MASRTPGLVVPNKRQQDEIVACAKALGEATRSAKGMAALQAYLKEAMRAVGREYIDSVLDDAQAELAEEARPKLVSA